MTLEMIEHNLLGLMIIATMVAIVSLIGFYYNRMSMRRRQRKALESLRSVAAPSVSKTAEHLK